jgi:hypothetical protein
MIRATVTNTLLFWVMVLLGAVLVAPCLILPPWLEHQAALQVEKLKQARLKELEKRLAVLNKQNEYRNDPSYLERLEREEFGGAPPGAQAIYINPELLEQTAAALQQRSEAEKETRSGQRELSDELQALMLKYPVTQAFARPETRPILLALGSGLILLAVLLLCRALPERS